MIRIHKPETAPAVLRTRGATKRDDLCCACEAGEPLPAFDGRLYGHSEVKAALIAAQHGKCCFCESKVGEDGDVEHFRPKAGYRQSDGEPLTVPGYYWLAYEWTNLLLSCPACNSRHKGNLFPLAAGGVRTTAPNGDLTAELPLFLDPAAEDPADHIAFDRFSAVPLNGSERGRMTIEALGLNRLNLLDRRERRWRIVQQILKVLGREAELRTTAAGRRTIEDLRSALTDLTDVTEEFTAMAVSAATSWQASTTPRP